MGYRNLLFGSSASYPPRAQFLILMRFQFFCSKTFLSYLISVFEGDSFLLTSLNSYHNLCICLLFEPLRDKSKKFPMVLSFRMESNHLVRPYNHHHLQIYVDLCTTFSTNEAFVTNCQSTGSILTFYRKSLVSAFVPLLKRHLKCLVYGKLKKEIHLQNG